MDKRSLATKAILEPKGDLTNSFIARLYRSNGLTIKESIEANECDVINYDYSNVNVISKDKIKEQVLFSKYVILYLNIDLTQVPSDRIIKPPSCEVTKTVPFVCLGWSDHEYLNSFNKQGKKVRNRGYLMLYPIDRPIIKENLYYLPYKFVKNDEDEKLVQEVWYLNDVDNTIIPYRTRIEMKMGETIFKDAEKHYESDVAPYYHIKGNPLIPLRVIAEHFGYTVSWKRFTKTIILNKDSKEIIIKVGENKCFINGIESRMFLPVYINKDTKRSYVTLGVIRNIFNCDAEFIKEDQLIKIYKNN